MRALLLPLGVDLYAIELDLVREVLPLPVIATVPTAPPTILGVFNLRGEVVPVLDTAAVLGVVDAEAGPPEFVAVVETALGPAALVATGLPRAADLGASVGTTELVGTAGSFAVESRIAVLIELDTLLAPARLGAEQ